MARHAGFQTSASDFGHRIQAEGQKQHFVQSARGSGEAGGRAGDALCADGSRLSECTALWISAK
eukprot:1107176-Rhodomonas_salina.1